MHHLTILLVKADDKEEARTKADSFLEPHGEGRIWDWYQVGGRWSGVLDPHSDAFYKWAGTLVEHGFACRWIDDNKKLLQDKWEEMGGNGDNPLTRNGSIGYRGDNGDDIMPLSSCLEAVKWHSVTDKEATLKELADKFNAEKDRWAKAFAAEQYYNVAMGHFYFEASVYNVEDYGIELPEDPTGYWAVVIDMHN
jgi:hypothetical protein